jgi:hypothetical protein
LRGKLRVPKERRSNILPLWTVELIWKMRLPVIYLVDYRLVGCLGLILTIVLNIVVPWVNATKKHFVNISIKIFGIDIITRTGEYFLLAAWLCRRTYGIPRVVSLLSKWFMSSSLTGSFPNLISSSEYGLFSGNILYPLFSTSVAKSEKSFS